MLSVVIVTCNRMDSLVKTIQSCIECIKMEWELVLVDNGSKDGTKLMVDRICKENDIPLQYYCSEENLGVAGGRNIGFQLAKGDVLYFIDDDAIIENCGVDSAYRYLMENKHVQILSTKIWDQLWDGILPEITAYGKKMTNGVQLRSFIGCSHFIRKDDFFKSELYPHNLFYGGEEAYLSYYVYKNGGSVEYYENVFVRHYPSNKTRTSYYDMYRNRILNWYIVKQYYYPMSFLAISTVVYWYRILKLSKCNLKKLIEVRKLRRLRFDLRYKDTMKHHQMKSIIHKFGFRYLV